MADQRDHGKPPEAGESDLDETPQEIKEYRYHVFSAPFFHSIRRSEFLR